MPVLPPQTHPKRERPSPKNPRARAGVALTCALLCGLALSACTDRPDLAGRTAPLPANTPWPVLVPTQDLDIAQSQRDTETIAAEANTLAARAANLQARGRALANRPVLSAATRARLLAATR